MSKSDNNFVAMEQNVCPVCGVTHTHNTGLMLHKRLGNIKVERTVTGYGLCAKHDKLHKDGYLAMVGVTNDQDGGSTLHLKDAERSGRIAHIKYDVVGKIFDTTFTPDTEFVFVADGVIDYLDSLPQEQAPE